MTAEEPISENRPTAFQFGLGAVFLLFLVVASALAAMGPFGLVVAALVLVTAVLGHSARIESRWATTLQRAILGSILVAGLIALLVPSVDGPYGPSDRSRCMNHLKQLALALHVYHEGAGSFPPAHTADENGKPTHSWRTMVLPYLELEALQQSYRFDEPWNSKSNARVAQSPNRLLRCPSEVADGPLSSYVAVVGPNTA